MAVPPQERLEFHTMPVTESGCLIWIGSVNHLGYGRFATNGGHVGAHRMAWTIHRGEIPAGANVLHKCDVRCCVNPEHLFLGTRSDNMRDMWSKRRHPGNRQHGERNSQAKLTSKQVEEIRQSAGTIREIAEKFHVSRGCIGAIKTNTNWRT